MTEEAGWTIEDIVLDDDHFNYPEVAVRTLNPSEMAVAHMVERDGWTVIKRGWPDFIAVRGDEIRLVEVKGADNRTGLRKQQRVVANILHRFFGIKTEVIRAHRRGEL